MTNKFRTPQNVRLTRGLFYETTLADKDGVLYTLKNEDHAGYPSLYLLYLLANDPTEYRFATTYLDGWDHWQELSKCTWFQPYAEKWRAELEVRTRSEALSRILKMSVEGGREAFAANKYVIESFEYKTSKAGRPSKEAIRKVAEEHFHANSQIADDIARLKLNS